MTKLRVVEHLSFWDEKDRNIQNGPFYYKKAKLA